MRRFPRCYHARMWPVILTFGWFPLFFVFMAMFVDRCRRSFSEPAQVRGDGVKSLTLGADAKAFFVLAAVLPSALALASCGLYVLFALGQPGWAIAFFLFGVLCSIAILVWSRSVMPDATYDEERWCNSRGRGGVCLRWSDVSIFSFDSFTCCYFAIGSEPGESVTTKVRVSAFARGILEFEDRAREQLGEGKVQSAIAAAHRRRSAARTVAKAQ
ncbi:MAG: hypothetical protein KDC95_17305 [Planctomycetes bacterium]|nr:hypothetical protein [Planctomycetota bacterium]